MEAKGAVITLLAMHGIRERFQFNTGGVRRSFMWDGTIINQPSPEVLRKLGSAAASIGLIAVDPVASANNATDFLHSRGLEASVILDAEPGHPIAFVVTNAMTGTVINFRKHVIHWPRPQPARMSAETWQFIQAEAVSRLAPPGAETPSPSPLPDLGVSMKRVTGIGGIFFKAGDAPALRAWYKRHLGIDVQEWGGAAFTWADGEGKPVAGTTAWSIASAQSDQFAPGTAAFMVNYRVEDLHALVDALREEGCNVLGKIDDSEYGRFAWVIDPEGNKVELWQPPAGQ